MSSVTIERRPPSHNAEYHATIIASTYSRIHAHILTAEGIGGPRDRWEVGWHRLAPLAARLPVLVPCIRIICAISI